MQLKKYVSGTLFKIIMQYPEIKRFNSRYFDQRVRKEVETGETSDRE